MYRDSLNGRPLIGSPIMSGGVSLLENRIKKRFSFVVGDFLCSNIKNTLYIYSHCNLVGLKHIHTENFFLKNLIKETRNQIVFTVFRQIWIQTDVRLDPNQSENGKYNLTLGLFNQISKKYLFVYRQGISHPCQGTQKNVSIY